VKKSEEYFDDKLNNSLYENIDKTLENIRNAFYKAFVRKKVVIQEDLESVSKDSQKILKKKKKVKK
jgi:hypothetical protein